MRKAMGSEGKIRGFARVAQDARAGIVRQAGNLRGRHEVLAIPGDLLEDSISTPRGLAIKIIGVDGKRLEGSERDSTQDFVVVNGPTFNATNAKAFHRSLKLLCQFCVS
jgi:hypothetical protein